MSDAVGVFVFDLLELATDEPVGDAVFVADCVAEPVGVTLGVIVLVTESEPESELVAEGLACRVKLVVGVLDIERLILVVDEGLTVPVEVGVDVTVLVSVVLALSVDIDESVPVSELVSDGLAPDVSDAVGVFVFDLESEVVDVGVTDGVDVPLTVDEGVIIAVGLSVTVEVIETLAVTEGVGESVPVSEGGKEAKLLPDDNTDIDANADDVRVLFEVRVNAVNAVVRAETEERADKDLDGEIEVDFSVEGDDFALAEEEPFCGDVVRVYKNVDFPDSNGDSLVIALFVTEPVAADDRLICAKTVAI